MAMWIVLEGSGLDGDYRDLSFLLAFVSLAFVLERPGLAVLAFALAAAMLFVKFSSGLMAALVAVGSGVAWGTSRRRWRVLALGSALLAAAVLLIGRCTLGSIAGLVDYFSGMVEVADGHGRVMSNPYLQTSHAWVGAAVVAFCWGAAGLAVLRRSLGAMPLFAAALPLLLAFKHSFLREDEGHISFVFLVALVAMAAATVVAVSRREHALFATAFVSIWVALFCCWGEDARAHLQDVENIALGRTAFASVQTLLHFQDVRVATRKLTAERLREDRLPDDWRDALRGADSLAVVP
jgi:hypothetical protein